VGSSFCRGPRSRARRPEKLLMEVLRVRLELRGACSHRVFVFPALSCRRGVAAKRSLRPVGAARSVEIPPPQEATASGDSAAGDPRSKEEFLSPQVTGGGVRKRVLEKY